MAKVQMLVCDDDPAVSKSLTGYFEAEGMDVLCASSSVEDNGVGSAKEIANNMKETIRIHSEEHSGIRVSFTVSLA